MTPRQFDALAERHKVSLARADRRAGVITAMIYNMKRDVEQDPKGWSWLDVFPEHKPEQTEEQMQKALLAWAESFQGLPS